MSVPVSVPVSRACESGSGETLSDFHRVKRISAETVWRYAPGWLVCEESPGSDHLSTAGGPGKHGDRTQQGNLTEESQLLDA